jgi:hypothetical protein
MHAEKIANRIIQLGGTPVMNPSSLLQSSGKATNLSMNSEIPRSVPFFVQICLLDELALPF